MENELNDTALKSHGELCVLRLLVEAMLMSMTPEQQIAAIDRHHAACERLVAALLGDAPREDFLTAIQRAVYWQWARLESMDAPLPQEVLEMLASTNPPS